MINPIIFSIGNFSLHWYGVIVMAGVPDIMRSMLVAVTNQLRTGPKINSVSIVLARAEGDIADLFAAHQAAYPDVAMGSYPSFADGRYRTELVLRSPDAMRLEEARARLAQVLAEREFL